MTFINKNDSCVGKSATDTAVDSRTLPSRLGHALLSEGPGYAEQLTVVYKCMAAKLGAVFASLRQAAVAMSSQVTTEKFDEL